MPIILISFFATLFAFTASPNDELPASVHLNQRKRYDDNADCYIQFCRLTFFRTEQRVVSVVGLILS
jgi:hypothetical protein